VVHSQTGLISSPNWPDSYRPSTECIWDVNVLPGYHMRITFNETFRIEHSPTCSNDYVQVRDFLI